VAGFKYCTKKVFIILRSIIYSLLSESFLTWSTSSAAYCLTYYFSVSESISCFSIYYNLFLFSLTSVTSSSARSTLSRMFYFSVFKSCMDDFWESITWLPFLIYSWYSCIWIWVALWTFDKARCCCSSSSSLEFNKFFKCWISYTALSKSDFIYSWVTICCFSFSNCFLYLLMSSVSS